jgi:uncharacterized protein
MASRPTVCNTTKRETCTGRYNKTMNSIRQSIEQLCQENRIRLLYVFGSRAMEMLALLNGEQKTFSVTPSDVDLAVLTDAKLTAAEKVRLTLALEKIFNVERVDLVTLAEADPFLAANIIRGELLYALDPHEADEYELYVLRRAGDLADLERERMALILHEESPKYDAS